MKSRNSPLKIGITLGDPCGIGPEIVQKALKHSAISKGNNFILIGDSQTLNKYFPKKRKNVSFLEIENASKRKIVPGRPTPESSRIALESLQAACQMIQSKEVDALVTAPLTKEGVVKHHTDFQGHTEFLANAFKVKHVEMMFVANNLRVIIVTRHVPILQLPQLITKKSVLKTIQSTHSGLKEMFRIKSPRIAICGLNPHAGEGGLIGKEDMTQIIPAIKQAKTQHINAVGPFAADTLFITSKLKQYDAIIAMYHDQGLIPIKTLGLDQLVNLTIGLPFIRTSPAHGTAFDIAGTNQANHKSMLSAIKLAIQLSK